MLLLSGPRGQPSSRPGGQTPTPPPQTWGSGPSPSSDRGPDPLLPPSDRGVKPPVPPPQTWGSRPLSPSSRPRGPGPQPSPSSLDPGVQPPALPLRPRGPDRQSLPAQTQEVQSLSPSWLNRLQACLLPLNTHTVQYPEVATVDGHLPAAAGGAGGSLFGPSRSPPCCRDKPGAPHLLSPAATTEAQAPRAELCSQSCHRRKSPHPHGS